MKRIIAKYAGQCSNSACRKPITPGDAVGYVRAAYGGKARTVCTACLEAYERRLACDDDDARSCG